MSTKATARSFTAKSSRSSARRRSTAKRLPVWRNFLAEPDRSRSVSGIWKKTDEKRNIGNIGERRAEEYLRRRGFEILAKNWVCNFGEIDLICRDGDRLVFVEVKTRIG